MKTLKRIFYGLVFIPAFMVTMFVVAPINWMLYGSLSYPLDRFTKFYESL